MTTPMLQSPPLGLEERGRQTLDRTPEGPMESNVTPRSLQRWHISGRRERILVIALAVGLVLLRSAVFVFGTQPQFDSDQAIVGLMAKHLSEMRALPIFFYGQHYMLAVEAWLAAPLFYPGFPFCPPDQGLYTPTRLSARQISSAHVIPLPTPVRWGRARRETDWSPCFQGISQAPLHTCALSSPLRCTQAARQPPGTGSAQILRSMSPNSRRVRCPSASRSQ